MFKGLNVRRLASLLLAAGTVAALLALAGMLPQASFRAGVSLPEDFFGQRLQGPSEMSLPAGWLDAIWIFWWVAAGISILYAASTPEMRKKLLRMTLLLGLALALGYLIYGRPDTPLETPTPEATETAVTPIPNQEVDVTDLDAPAAAVPVDDVVPPNPLGIVASILILTLLGLAAYRWWRGSTEPPRPWLADLQQRAQVALDELRQGEQLDDAILRCYREMVIIVETQRGVRRKTAVTAREFEAELARSGLPQRAVQRLTRLFELVRYGDYRPTPRDRMEAVDSLEAIVAACSQLVDAAARPREERR